LKKLRGNYELAAKQTEYSRADVAVNKSSADFFFAKGSLIIAGHRNRYAIILKNKRMLNKGWMLTGVQPGVR